MDAVEILESILPKRQHGKIEKIIQALGLDAAHEVEEVAIIGARVGVSTVDAYGLVITVDACGNAESVSFPYGAEVIVGR